jgi:hypothetical protein
MGGSFFMHFARLRLAAREGYRGVRGADTLAAG